MVLESLRAAGHPTALEVEDWFFARAGEVGLPGPIRSTGDLAEIGAHVERCEVCQARVRGLEAERAAFLEQHPPEALLGPAFEALERPSPPRWGRRAMLAAAAVLLVGLQGTGKSTWVRERYESALWIDLLKPGTYRRYETDPGHLEEVIRGNPECSHVVLDEIQKVPALLDVVHSVLEQPDSPVFVLTGSSARKLRRTGVDLLAGRAVLRTMHPFMAAELGDRISIDEALQTGLVPVVLDADDPQDVLDAYAALYLREEVQAEGLVRNLAGFARFLLEQGADPNGRLGGVTALHAAAGGVSTWLSEWTRRQGRVGGGRGF